jgi:hypothetical protein
MTSAKKRGMLIGGVCLAMMSGLAATGMADVAAPDYSPVLPAGSTPR